MNRNLASALTVGATAVAAITIAALGPTKAYADDITVDNTPFVSSKSRSEVRAELMGQSNTVWAGASEWALQRNEVPRLQSGYTIEQARSQFKTSRLEVSALTGEDSGSAYLTRVAMPSHLKANAVMGAPAR